MRTLYRVSVVCRLGWKTADKIRRSGRFRVKSAHSLSFPTVCLILVADFSCRREAVEVWANDRVVIFIEDLQSGVCLWDVHCADYLNRNKGDETFLHKI